MANFESNRVVNRRPARFQQVEGTELRLQTFGSPPETRLGGFPSVDPDTGLAYQYFLDYDEVVNGAMIAVSVNNGLGAIYNELYVWIESAYAWKKVDLDWPKIDPRTGKPYDQFLEWYSPLAE